MSEHDRAAEPRPVTVTIAVLTYRRPDDLAELLPLLVALAASAAYRVGVTIVDNDPDAGAAAFVQDWAGRGPVRYVHEPRPGIAAARNRALDEASDAELLVFIDDDERPGPDWLADLLRVREREGCAAVVGPVVSRYAVEPDPWIAAGEFFRRRRLPTGTDVDVAATNNLLLDLGRVRAHGLRFDERFGLIGGEDTLFTRSLVAAGERLVWCDEAVVTDVVPPARLTRSWVLRRAFSSGNTAALVEAELHPGWSGLRRRARRVGDGLVRAAGGGARAALGTVLASPAHQARGCRTAARGAGMISGAAGYRYGEYRRT